MSRSYAAQPEILEYMRKTVTEFDLWPHIRLSTGITAAERALQADDFPIRRDLLSDTGFVWAFDEGDGDAEHLFDARD